MARRDDTPGLFGPMDEPAPIGPAPADDALRALAARLPPALRFGTSSWNFPGWAGLVWDRAASERDLARRGIPAYAAHPLLGTVGLDRAFYRPLPQDEYAQLAAQAGETPRPAGFTFLVKAWQSITRPDADEQGRTHGDTRALAEAGRPNTLFLDPSAATDLVLGPAAAGLGDALGPVVFQFPPLDLSRSGTLGGAAGLLDRLGRFLACLPMRLAGRAPLLAVELRNRELFTPEHAARLAEVLSSAGAALSFAGHPSVPPMDEQERALAAHGWGVADQPALVARWLLRPDQTYDGAKRRYGPFTHIVDPDVPARSALAGLAVRAAGHGRPGWIIVNNKAEGSAPRSIERLAGAVADRVAPSRG